MTGRPRPLQRAADLFVFAPLGFLLEAPRLLPELARTGRRRLLGCRQEGQSRPAEATVEPAPTLRSVARPGPTAPDLVDAAEELVIAVEREDEPADGGGGGLPIPGYDQLAASQVIARLPGLSQTELSRIEDHESSHRRRRTVLAKISQLRT
jgi:hypothetical protein